MKKSLKIALSCAAALALLTPVTAVSQTYGPHIQADKSTVKQKQKPTSRLSMDKKFAQNYPALCHWKYKRAEKAKEGQFVEVKSNAATTAVKKGKTQQQAKKQASHKKSLLTSVAGRELYGNVIYSQAWDDEDLYGLYTFNATDPVSPSVKWRNDWCVANGGGALVGDVYHTVRWTQSGDGSVNVSYMSFEAETGWVIDDHSLYDNISLVATEVAVASDGTVYGEFYNSTGNGYELGIADYANFTHTTIGTLSNWYLAMGITSDNTIYGIASTGDLYRINAETAEETLVGSTGIELVDSEGGAYVQSGEIDQKNNVFYWAAIPSDGISRLYTVDLNTAAATLVGTFEDNEIVCGLSIPKPIAEDGAPAAIDNVDFNFVDASLTGTVNFTAPSTTYAGGALSGTLNYTITCDGETLATSTCEAGAAVSKEVTVSGNGIHTFVVSTSNSEGKSPDFTQEKYVGYDEPNWVENVSLTADSNGKVTLTWDAPTYGVNDGYIGELKYRITRYPDEVVVAEAQEGTTFSETLTPDQLTIYYYNIAAVNGDMVGTEVSSKTVIVGPAITLPYDNTFADSSSLDYMTIIDGNQDGTTWEYHWEQQCASCAYTFDSQSDDWLVTPPLKVEANKMYAIRFVASPMIENDDRYYERMEVKIGVGADPTTYTTVVLDPTEITKQTTYTYNYLATADADVKIAFHAISDPDKFNLLLREVHMSAGSELTAPAAASEVTVDADNKGALKATVSCKLPETTVGGDALSSLKKVEFYRNGELCKTCAAGIMPGTQLYYEDTVSEDGIYTYKVVCYNDNGKGLDSEEASDFVGVDEPGAIDGASIKATVDGSTIKVSWDAVTTGKNGGYVDPSKITYELYSSIYYDDFFGYEFGDQYGTVTGQTTCTVNIDPNSGDQAIFPCYVIPKNDKGYGEHDNLASDFIVGEAYSLPFKETFDNGGVSTYWIVKNQGSTWWNMLSDFPSPDGGTAGVAFAYCNNGDAANLATGKIAPNGANNLKLFFALNAAAGANCNVEVQVQKADLTSETVKAIPVDATAVEDDALLGWTTYEVPLAAYANESHFLVRFIASGDGIIYMDDVEVRTVLANDLAVTSVSAPKSVKKGEKAAVSVAVKNVGDNAASGYTVRLLADDKVVEEKTVNDQLQPMGTTAVDFTYATSVATQESTVKLTAEVVYTADENADNNQASTTMGLVNSGLDAPKEAGCDVTESGIKLNWLAPDTSAHQVTDDFEGYDTWAVDSFGEWTGYDGDKGYTGSMFSDYTYGHQGEKFAFEVFEPVAIFDDILEANPDMTPHSGNKYAAAIFGSNEYGDWVDGDNWLISPALSGDAQTITLFANNCGSDYAETMELYYSLDGTATDNFVLVDTKTLTTGEWQEISFDVPAGAKYFAIRQTSSEGGYILGIDDVTYTVGSKNLVNFNIYRDGSLIATVGSDATSYTDADNNGSTAALYGITAVYDNGESAPAYVDYIPGSVEQLEAGDGVHSFTVYGPDGRLYGKDLKTLKNLSRGVYIVNGQKVVIK